MQISKTQQNLRDFAIALSEKYQLTSDQYIHSLCVVLISSMIEFEETNMSFSRPMLGYNIGIRLEDSVNHPDAKCICDNCENGNHDPFINDLVNYMIKNALQWKDALSFSAGTIMFALSINNILSYKVLAGNDKALIFECQPLPKAELFLA